LLYKKFRTPLKKFRNYKNAQTIKWNWQDNAWTKWEVQQQKPLKNPRAEKYRSEKFNRELQRQTWPCRRKNLEDQDTGNYLVRGGKRKKKKKKKKKRMEKNEESLPMGIVEHNKKKILWVEVK